LSINWPTNKNKGTATSKNEFIAENILSDKTLTGVEVKIKMLATLDKPSAIAKGQPKAHSSKNRKRRVRLIEL